MLKSAENELRPIVLDMVHNDKKFDGWTLYIANIAFFWSESINTACAGHGFIFFNPHFWDKLDEDKQKTVIAHEICHLILDHLNRGEGYDHESYNIAGDYVINNYLHDEGFDTQGMFGDIEILFDRKYVGQTTEQVYASVHEERKQNPSSHGGSNTPSKDQIEEMVQEALKEILEDPDFEEQVKKNQEEIEANQNRKPGNEQGNSMILLEGVKRVEVVNATYQQIFEPYLTDPLSGGKRTYLRPSRRQAAGGLRLKGKFPKRGKLNRLTHLVYALDVSGSISRADADAFINSAHTIKEMLNPKNMTVMLWDTRIVFEKTYRDDEKLGKIRVHAGGGTDLKPVYNRVKQLQPEALVIFTDLAVSIPPKPDWETIWLVNSTVHDGYLQAVKYGTVYQLPKDKT